LIAVKHYEFGKLLHVLVVPGELHFLGIEALTKIAHAPKGF